MGEERQGEARGLPGGGGSGLWLERRAGLAGALSCFDDQDDTWPWLRTLATILEVRGLGKNGAWPSSLKTLAPKLLPPELDLNLASL